MLKKILDKTKNPEIIKVGNEVYMPDANNNGVKVKIFSVEKLGDKISDWQVSIQDLRDGELKMVKPHIVPQRKRGQLETSL